MASSKKNTIVSTKKILNKESKYNIPALKSYLCDQNRLETSAMLSLIDRFKSILHNEPNVMEANGKITIVGDIHGQYFDFLKVLSLQKNLQEPDAPHLLFLGDYVDRGINSVEVITLIMCLKTNYPKKVTLLRGNHQSRCMTMTYNFYKQIVQKYNQDIYHRLMEAFDHLPLACIVNKKIFCVHGGLPFSIQNAKKINQIDRFSEIPMDGDFTDMVWSDPTKIPSGKMSKLASYNEERKCSIYFGEKLTNKFLKYNNFSTIIRAHQVFPEGHKQFYWDQNSKKPTIVSIFSAPNYCGAYSNLGAIVQINQTNIKIKQFKQQTEIKNKFHQHLQVFEWSIPQITKIINSFSAQLMNSFYKVNLQKDFPKMSQTTAQQKVQFMLGYKDMKQGRKSTIKVDKKEKKEKKERIQKARKNSNESSSGKTVDIDEREQLFNRSCEYFQKQKMPQN